MASKTRHPLPLGVLYASLLLACDSSIANTNLLNANSYPRFIKAWESREFAASNMRLHLQLERFLDLLDSLDKKQKFLTDRCLGLEAEKMFLRRQGKAIIIWPERFGECEEAWSTLSDRYGSGRVFVGGLNSQLGTNYPVPVGDQTVMRAWETLKAELTLFPAHCTDGSHRIWTSNAYPNAESPKSIYARLKSVCPKEWVDFYSALDATQADNGGRNDAQAEGNRDKAAAGSAGEAADRLASCDESHVSRGQVTGAGAKCNAKRSDSNGGSGEGGDQSRRSPPPVRPPAADGSAESRRDAGADPSSDSGRAAATPDGGQSNRGRGVGHDSLDDELGAIGMPQRGSARNSAPGQPSRGQLLLQQHIQRAPEADNDLLRAAAAQEARAEQYRATADRATGLLAATKRAQDCLAYTRARRQASADASAVTAASSTSAPYVPPPPTGTPSGSGNPNAISNPRTSFPFLRADSGPAVTENDPCAEPGAGPLAAAGAGQGSAPNNSFEAVARESGSPASGCDDAAQDRREEVWFAPRQAQVMKFDGTARYACEVLKLAAEHLTIQIAYSNRCHPSRVSALRQELQLREREQRQHCNR